MNKYQKVILSLPLVLGLLARSFRPAQAQAEAPNFPACSNPLGTLQASYETGVHGIVGSPSQFIGRDRVYRVDDLTLIQCFCAEDGHGIQTNWWKINSLTQDEINTSKGLGWIFVPNGSDWGLDSAPYLAKNSDYTCEAAATSESADDDGNGTGGLVLGAGSVLGLAATGNSLALYSLLLLGLISILLGKK